MTDERPKIRAMTDDEDAFVFGPLVDVADGEHPAQLVELSVVPVEWDGELRDRIRWDFAVEAAGAESPPLVAGWTSRATGERSTARKWIAALLGSEGIANGRRVKRGELVGRPGRIIVEHDDNGYPKVGLVLAPKGGRG
jgi:hypothetical protein